MLTEQEKVRREALSQLIAMGINPYPGEEFPINISTQRIHDEFDELAGRQFQVQIAGRIMSKRIMGNASFAELQDSSGRIQIYLRRDDLCPDEDKTLYNVVFKKMLDIGDFIGIEGTLFTTQLGEKSIAVSSLKLLSKSLRPLPIVKQTEDEAGNVQMHDAVTDPEFKYRQRYADLVVNPSVKEVFIKRSRIITSLRQFLNDHGLLEVETPILQPIHGGATARPFKTYHNTLETTLYLRIANELYLKRLIVGGFDGVYEFAKDFRNEGMSRFHNPEFTQVELYVAYKDYRWMMDFVETMIEFVALKLYNSTQVQVGQNLIDFKRPWKRMTMFDSIKEATGADVSKMDEESLKAVCTANNVPFDDTMGKSKLVDALFGELVEHKLIQPTFITDYPVEMSPLAKRHRDNPELVERFEGICNGKEICNAFSELNDPIDQRKRFEEQVELGKRGDLEAMAVDEDFLRALEYGMPPTVGLGVGIDRLTMILTNQPSIQDVLLFPQMKAEVFAEGHSGLDFAGIGVDDMWVEGLEGLSFTSMAEFADFNPNKIFNHLGGFRKKNKIPDNVPTVDTIRDWQARAKV